MPFSKFTSFPGVPEEYSKKDNSKGKEMVISNKKKYSKDDDMKRDKRRERKRHDYDDDRRHKRLKDSSRIERVEHKSNKTSDSIPNDYFIIDKRPDRDNLRYGCSDKGSMPKYYTNKYISPLGSNTELLDQRIPERDDDIKIIPWKEWELEESLPVDQAFAVESGQQDEIKSDFIPIPNELKGAVEKGIVIDIDEDSAIRKRLNAAVVDNPENIDAWLELVSFQDRTLSKDRSEKELSAVRERKIAILERAIDKNPQASALVVLRLRMISEISSFDEINEEAERYLKKYPDDLHVQLYVLELWTFKHKNAGYSHVRERIGRMIRMYGHSGNACLILLLRSLVLDFEAGYIERALAVSTCVIHLNTRMKQIKNPWEKMKALGKMWESGDSELFFDEFKNSDVKMPVRASEANESTNPDSIVLFEEIEPFLIFCASKTEIALVKRYFYHLIGFTLPFEGISLDVLEDALIHPGIKSFQNYWAQFSMFPLFPQTLFWELSNLRRVQRVDLSSQYLELVEYHLLQTAEESPLDFCLFLRFQMELDESKTTSFAQTFLSNCGFVIEFWRPFLLYTAETNPTQAKEYCIKLIAPDCEWNHALSKFSIVRILCDLSIKSGSSNNILQYVSSILSNKPLSETLIRYAPSAILSITKKLQSYMLNITGSVDDFDYLMDILCILGWIHVCNENFEKALKLFQDPAAEMFQPGSVHHQMFLVNKCRFITLLSHYKPTLTSQLDLRVLVKSAAHTFPLNTLLVDYFITMEERFRVDAQLEHFVKQSFSLNTNIIYFVYKFHIADMRHDGAERLRSVCEESVSALSCPSLWSLYLLFELQNGKLQKSKRVFYRAIATCPFSKDLYGKAFMSPLNTQFNEQEIQDLQEIMLMREVRIDD